MLAQLILEIAARQSQAHSHFAAELMSERTCNSPPPICRTSDASFFQLPHAFTRWSTHNGMDCSGTGKPSGNLFAAAYRLRGVSTRMAAQIIPAGGWAEIPHDVLERVFQTLPVRGRVI